MPHGPGPLPRRLSLGAALALGAPAALGAQAPTPCPYAECALRLEPRWGGEALVRGEAGVTVTRVSIGGGSVVPVLGRVAAAAPAAREFARRRRRSLAASAVAGAAVGYVAASSRFGRRDRVTGGEVGALVLAVPTAVYGASEALKSRRALHRALWLFNRAPVR